MVTLYHLDREIRILTDRINEECDQETGAIPVELWEQMDALVARQEGALADVACALKERRAEAKAIREEAKTLVERARGIEGVCERLESLLEERVGPEGLTDPRVRVRWRTSKAVELTAPPETLPELYRRVRVEADRVGLGAALKAGAQIEGAVLVERQNLIVQ